VYLLARGRLERYEELKDGMFEGDVGAQDERQVSWRYMAINYIRKPTIQAVDVRSRYGYQLIM
jgi:hypothetical protein